MSMTARFLSKIKYTLETADPYDISDPFYALENYFLDHADELLEESETICRLGDMMQDEIAEMGDYEEDNIKHCDKIQEIYHEMYRVAQEEKLIKE